MNASTTQPEWYRVTEAKKLGEVIDKAIQFKGPALVEIITDADLI